MTEKTHISCLRSSDFTGVGNREKREKRKKRERKRREKERDWRRRHEIG